MGRRLVASAIVVASACTALHFSTTEQKAVVVSNNPYTFTGSGSQMFVISAAGSSDHDVLLGITPTNCNSQWTIDTSIDPQQPVAGAHVCGGLASQTLVGGSASVGCPASYQLAVRFAGTQQGSSSCNVVVDTQAYGGSTYGNVTLRLYGSGSANAGISVTPSQVNFGDVQINSASTSSKVQVKNTGSAAVTVNGSLSGSPTFQVTPGVASFGLGPGSSAFFDVTCTPPGLGPHGGALSFSAGASSGSASLVCNGIDSAVDLAPTRVSFDATLVGRAPADQTVMITGAGSASIENVALDSAAIAAGVTIVDNPQGELVGSGNAIVLGFSASTVHPAGSLGTLSIKVDVDAQPRSVAITGQALLGGLGVNPASLEFGAVCVGSKLTKSVEVFASEAGDVVLQQAMQPEAPFSVTVPDTLPKTLGGDHTGASATARVTLMPTIGGEFKTSLALASDVPMMGTTKVELRGVAIDQGVAATPDEVHFGTMAAGMTTAINEVQLTNCSTAELRFDRVYLAGANAEEYTLIGANPSRMVAAGESEVFMVVMQPKTNGFKTAQLVAEHGEGKTVVALDGTGEGAEDKERETYYACSTGRSSALWPLMLALLGLRRRRQRRR